MSENICEELTSEEIIKDINSLWWKSDGWVVKYIYPLTEKSKEYQKDLFFVLFVKEG